MEKCLKLCKFVVSRLFETLHQSNETKLPSDGKHNHGKHNH